MLNIPQAYRTQKIYTPWLMLKLTYGLIPVIAGADKFFNVLVNWQQYHNPLIGQLLHLNPAHIMYLVGVIEIIAGLIVLSQYTRLGAYIVAAWLLAIAINLVTLGYYDIAVRDVAMAVGAYVLASLTQILEGK